VEPWYVIARYALLPPLRLWFNWHFEGLESIPRQGPIIVAGNHLSYLDAFAHACFVDEAGRRPRFLAKQELFKNWFLRTVLLGAGQIPVRRGSGDQKPLELAARALEAGEVVVVYPEGTSVTENPDFSPARGKTGAVRLSLMTGVPILPVATWGGQYIWRKHARISPGFGRPLWLKAGEPFDPSAIPGSSDATGFVRDSTDRLMGDLARLVDDLRRRYPERWTSKVPFRG
jgi:1-acyl-sn-glycerol-3-phosphate acyltransferase